MVLGRSYPIIICLVFLNDIQDLVEGGLWIRDINIRMVLYADDLVQIVSDPKIIDQKE